MWHQCEALKTDKILTGVCAWRLLVLPLSWYKNKVPWRPRGLADAGEVKTCLLPCPSFPGSALHLPLHSVPAINDYISTSPPVPGWLWQVWNVRWAARPGESAQPIQVNDNPTAGKSHQSLSTGMQQTTPWPPRVASKDAQTRVSWQEIKEGCVWILGMPLGKGGFF